MDVQTIRTNWANSELKQNTHIITIDDKCIIVDAGANLDEVMEIVGDKKVVAMLITHAHYDHISRLENYEIAFGCPIYVNEHSIDMLKDPKLNVSCYFGVDRAFDVKNLVVLKGKEDVEIGGIKFKAIYTPGHSVDGMCYLFEDGTLFTGDTVFAKAVGRTDLVTGNPKRLLVSLSQILDLDFNIAYTGHMRATTKEEQLSNIPTWQNYIKKHILDINK